MWLWLQNRLFQQEPPSSPWAAQRTIEGAFLDELQKWLPLSKSRGRTWTMDPSVSCEIVHTWRGQTGRQDKRQEEREEGKRHAGRSRLDVMPKEEPASLSNFKCPLCENGVSTAYSLTVPPPASFILRRQCSGRCVDLHFCKCWLQWLQQIPSLGEFDRITVWSFSLQARCKTQNPFLYHIQNKSHKMSKCVCSRLETGVEQRALADGYVQRGSCQSRTKSISSSQSVLFICWICFGTYQSLIDMDAEAGKTLHSVEQTSVQLSLPQMFGLRRCTCVIVAQKSGHSLLF